MEAPASGQDVRDTVALVPAAGRGERLGPGDPKSLRPLAGRPLVVHAVGRLAAARSVAAVVVAAPPGSAGRVHALLAPVVGDVQLVVVDGGADRQASVAAALAAAPPGLDVVLVHDAARALAPPDLADGVAAGVRAGHVAVVPVLPVVDTVKRVDAAGAVVATVDRADLRVVQTPQGFRRDVLVAVHADAARGHRAVDPAGGAAADAGAAAAPTDDATLVERAGLPVHTVPGRDTALKITRPVDLVVAEALIAAGRSGSVAPSSS